jgi:hypothetical protein
MRATTVGAATSDAWLLAAPLHAATTTKRQIRRCSAISQEITATS